MSYTIHAYINDVINMFSVSRNGTQKWKIFAHSLIQALSTCIRIFLNPQLFLSGFVFCPHVSGEFACESATFWIHSPEWKFLNPQTIWNCVDGRIRIFLNLMTWQLVLLFIDINKAIATWKKKHIKQTLFMLKCVQSLHLDAKLTAFSILIFFWCYRSWKLPKEIIRIRYSHLGSKRHYLNSSIVSSEFFICKYNIIFDLGLG